jgi:hypothetical protein
MGAAASIGRQRFSAKPDGFFAVAPCGTNAPGWEANGAGPEVAAPFEAGREVV